VGNNIFRLAVGCAVALWLGMTAAAASPWAEVGDNQLRSDIQILANANVIDDITTQWPIPWAGVLAQLKDEIDLSSQPRYVREAARRVLAYAKKEMHRGTFSGSASADFTNQPNVVRGFDAMGRNKAESQVAIEYMDTSSAIRISMGAYSDFSGRTTHYDPDGTYVAQRLGGAVLYAGYLSQWWGPGWISALSLSNNARPFPQVGIERIDSSAFRTPLLSWIGPWQAQFLVGWLDDKRVAMNTVYDGLRVTFNPLPGLEIGLARTQELCGTGHPCVPIAEYFEFANQASHVNRTNDEGVIDLHYTNTTGGIPWELYTQEMNEDSNPIIHSVTSHLFGASVWLPLVKNAMRLTVEYTDTVPTINIFSFGDVDHGAAYNNSGYPDGMHYRGKSLGFSLDSDSRLLSLQASWADNNDWTYEATFHHAMINDPNNKTGNVVSAVPVVINLAEARVTIPFKGVKFDLAARVQDDQPRPDHGFTGAFEAGISANF
jgi:Capsule assembly protein Wzi